jgi:hypothetical protein
MIRIVDPATLPRRWRTALVVLFALLLAGMQQEALRHAISHFNPAPVDTQLSTVPSDAPCAACALFAGGSAALVSSAPFPAAVLTDDVRHWPAQIAPAAASPSFYRSRAPPSLS